MRLTRLARIDILQKGMWVPALCDDGIVRSAKVGRVRTNAQSVSAYVMVKKAAVSGYLQIERICQLCLDNVDLHENGKCPDGRDVEPIADVLRFYTNVYGQNGWMIQKLIPKIRRLEP